MKTNTRLYRVLNCTVHVSVCRRFVCQRFWSVDVLIFRRFGLVLVCRRFGLSMFWSVNLSVCRRFGLFMFWYVDVLVCHRFSFGLSTFRYVSVSVCQRFGCRRFGLSTFSAYATVWRHVRIGHVFVTDHLPPYNESCTQNVKQINKTS